MDIGTKISSAIFEVGKSESKYLQSISDKGIFDIPELALVYLVGKKLALIKEFYFESEDYKWLREETLAKGCGPTDLAFTYEGKEKNSYAIEFKMDNTYQEYCKDIKKLKQLKSSNSNFRAYFASFKCVNDDEKESKYFLNILKNEFSKICEVKLIEKKYFDSFLYNKKVLCLYTFWEVL